MGVLLDKYSSNVLEEEEQVVDVPVPTLEETQTLEEAVTKPRVNRTLARLRGEKPEQQSVAGPEQEKEEFLATVANKNIDANSAVRQAAVRFVQDRLGMTNITDEDEAMEEYVEHFRSFNVNELTAAGDYRYVSAAASDASGKTNLRDKTKEKAAQRLSDYRLLHQTFAEMPAFSDGVMTTLGDYAGGILTAPSTYVGLLLPGVGKAGGVAASQAAKLGVNQTLKQAFFRPVSTLSAKAAANPIKTGVAVEGIAGMLQNTAAQKAEIAADLRDDFELSETALAFGLSGAPVAVLGTLAKGRLTEAVEAGTDEIVEKSLAAVTKADEEAGKAAKKTLTEKKVISQKVASALRPLDPEQVAAGKEVKGVIDNDLGIDDQFTLTSAPERTQRIFAAVTDVMSEDKIGLLDGERVTEGVARVIRGMDEQGANKGSIFLDDTLEKYNITYDDMANMFMADVSDAARTLQSAGVAARMFRNLQSVAAADIFGLDDMAKASVSKVAKAIDDLDPRNNLTGVKLTAAQEKVLAATKKLEGKEAGAGAFVRALDTARLASMTSQTATTVRNSVSGYSRVGIDTLVKALDRGIAASVGKRVRGPNEDIFASAYGLINKKEAQAVRDTFTMGFEKKAAKLFRELQDIDPKGASGSSKIESLRNYGKELNRLNTLSDDMFKRAAFVGSLKRQLNEKYTRLADAGMLKGQTEADFNLINIISEGKFNSVFGTKDGGKVLDAAVEDALYTTYQKSPNSAVGRAVIQGIHSAPFLLTSLVPFPRFIANAMRYTYEYSPLYLLQGGAKSLAKDANNYEEVSKAIVGTGILAGAFAFRSSENAGDNWWEYKMDDGRTFDMRPFFPAAPYLFAADLMKRYMTEGETMWGDRNGIIDSIQALTGTQFRAGFGIYALDTALKDLYRDDIDAGAKVEKLAANFGANVVSTFTIPLTAGQDLYNSFLAPDDEVIVRQTDATDVFQLIVQKSLARVPANYQIEKYMAESLGYNAPDIYETPTKEEPLRRQLPISRQFSGILVQERKNYLEREMARLKISRRKLSQRTGIPEADTLINTLMGEYSTDYIVPVLQNSDEYKDKDDEGKAFFIKTLIDDFRGDVIKAVKVNSRYSGKERYGFDPMQRAAFNEIDNIAQKKAIEKYHEIYGQPTEDKPYDYEVLTIYGKNIEKLMGITGG